MVRNLVLITIDSLRADRIGSQRGGHQLTPCIDRLASEGTRFTNAIATSSHTKDSFPGMFSSVLPSIQGSHHVDCSYEPLAVILSNAGYETAGYHSTPMMASYDYDAGFGVFKDLAETSTEGSSSNDLLELVPSIFLDPLHRLFKRYAPTDGIDAVDSRAPAEEISEAAIEYLDSYTEPFFLFVHYMDAHTPYWPPREYIDRHADAISERRVRELNETLLENKDSIHGDPDSISDRDLKHVRALYDASVRYVDACVNQLIEAMSNRGLLDDTIVVLTADHGEEFREHGGFFHGQKLYEELVRVPLLYWGPGIPEMTVDTQVSHLGLMPTILDHLGYEIPETSMGSSYASLFRRKEGGNEFALSETVMKRLGQDAGRVIACRHDSGLKLIFNERVPEWGTDQWELYDLDEDPQEQSNLFEDKHGGIVSQMKEKIAELRDGEIRNEEENEEVMDRLRDLGYAE